MELAQQQGAVTMFKLLFFIGLVYYIQCTAMLNVESGLGVTGPSFSLLLLSITVGIVAGEGLLKVLEFVVLSVFNIDIPLAA